MAEISGQPKALSPWNAISSCVDGQGNGDGPVGIAP